MFRRVPSVEHDLNSSGQVIFGGWAGERPSWWEPRSPTPPRVEGSGRTVLACPPPSRKRSTNQLGS
jgi:hypothetical protein